MNQTFNSYYLEMVVPFVYTEEEYKKLEEENKKLKEKIKNMEEAEERFFELMKNYVMNKKD